MRHSTQMENVKVRNRGGLSGKPIDAVRRRSGSARLRLHTVLPTIRRSSLISLSLVLLVSISAVITLSPRRQLRGSDRRVVGGGGRESARSRVCPARSLEIPPLSRFETSTETYRLAGCTGSWSAHKEVAQVGRQSTTSRVETRDDRRTPFGHRHGLSRATAHRGGVTGRTTETNVKEEGPL